MWTLSAWASHAREASELLKALAREGRLLILCDLLHGEKSVGELEARLLYASFCGPGSA